jgi:hypothetical protein
LAIITDHLGQSVILNRYHIFGRDPLISSTLLADIYCSKLHAIIFFDQGTWYFQDYSINGTIINNSIVQQKKIQLKSGETIQFFRMKGKEWLVENLDPPCSYLKRINNNNNNNNMIIALKKSIPVFYNDIKYSLKKGLNNKWSLKNSKNSIFLKNHEIVNYQNNDFLFVMNEPIEDTIKHSNSFKLPNINFELSENLEHVVITIDINGTYHKLPYKAQNFILYLLAKKHQEDIRNGKTSNEIGWIDNEKLLYIMNKELTANYDCYYLNLQIHRIRNQFKRFNLTNNLKKLIERRKGEIRMHNIQITIKGPNYPIFQD